jgi:hypothetical protein
MPDFWAACKERFGYPFGITDATEPGLWGQNVAEFLDRIIRQNKEM